MSLTAWLRQLADLIDAMPTFGRTPTVGLDHWRYMLPPRSPPFDLERLKLQRLDHPPAAPASVVLPSNFRRLSFGRAAAPRRPGYRTR